MLFDLLNKIQDSPRESLFLAASLALIGGMLAAMYMVCAGQVRTAQAQHAAAKVQRLAVLDCLDSDRRASYAACASQVATAFGRQPAPSAATMSALLTIDTSQPAPSAYAAPARNQIAAMVPVTYYTRGVH